MVLQYSAGGLNLFADPPPRCKLLPSSASQQRPWCWWVSALLRKQIYSGPLLLLVTATHLVTLSQVIKTALGRSRNPLICRLTKIFSFSDRGSQTESVTCQIKMPLRRKKHFLSRNLRFANSTEWRKLGRGIGRGEGHLRPPGFHLKVLLGSFHLKVLRESFPPKLFAGKSRKVPKFPKLSVEQFPLPLKVGKVRGTSYYPISLEHILPQNPVLKVREILLDFLAF